MNTQSLDECFLLIEEQLAEGNETAALDTFKQRALEDEKLTAAFIRYLLITGEAEAANKLMTVVEEEQTAWLEAARCMLALAAGDAPAARRYASSAIAKGADEDVIYDTIAQAMESLGLYSQAVAYYALAQRSDDSLVRILNIIRLLIQQGQFDQADAILTAIPEEDRADIALPLEVMLACAKQDKEKASELAAQLDAEDSILTAAAVLQTKLLCGETDLQPLAEELAQMELVNTDLLAADAFAQCGETERVKALLDRSAADENVGAQELIYIGHRYERIGCWKEALAVFEKADDGTLLRKYHYLIAAERALCLSELGRKSEALGMYRQLLADTRQAMLEGYTDTDLYLIQLRCHKALGNKEKMRELYEFACLIAADDETRQLLRRAVED